jgi:hypothetical protein
MQNTTANPIIYERGSSFDPSSLSSPDARRKWLPKIIFGILGLVIVIELINAYNTLKKASSNPVATSQFSRLAPLSSGRIDLYSNQKEFKVGDTISVSVRIFTGGHPTDGTDLVLKYDPQILDASGLNFFRKGNVYPDYPITTVDPNAKTIQISGITSLSQSGFNGAGVFAILNFKAKAAGKTSLMVDFQKDRTTDSNIIESQSAKDILGAVTNLDLNVK